MLSELLVLTMAVTPHEEPRPFGDDCRHTASREAVVDASGASRIRVDARAGSLRIEGKPGARAVTVRGRACASSESLLEQVQLDARRHAAEIEVLVELPEQDRWSEGQAWLDLVVEVPDSVPLGVRDTSGAAEIRGVGALDVEDGSGELVIAGVGGDLRVRDGSGEIDVRDVAGEVRIRDGSGEIQVRSVGSLIVEADGSGSIEVAGVRGDFTVGKDGSGGVRYRDVRGRVDVPRTR